MSIKMAATAAFALLASTVNAQSFNEPLHDTGRLWLTSGFFSQHSNPEMGPEGGYNESNKGLGIEYALTTNWRVAAGAYKNSYYKTTRYAQTVWLPDLTSTNVPGGRISLGASFGFVDGYADLNNGGAYPAILPVLSAEWGHAGANLVYIPSIKGTTSGAVALQLKLRLY